MFVFTTQNADVGGLDQRIGDLNQHEAPTHMGLRSSGIMAEWNVFFVFCYFFIFCSIPYIDRSTTIYVIQLS